MIWSPLCIAAALYGEARGESIDGQIAIADVIRNRVEDARYADDACAVVFSGQFAPATEFRNPAALVTALGIAFSDATLGLTSTHFHSGSPPYWAAGYAYDGQIGGHYFFTNEGNYK